MTASLGSKYRVVGELGRGGMGVVLEAENTLTNATVAIKILSDLLSTDPDTTARFLREARATARLRSRFIVTLLDVDRDERGVPYIVMERLVGRNLATELRERVEPIPIGEAVGWIIQAAAGLARAHEAGVVHRDLKPANLFLAGDAPRVVKVLDFGVSKIASEEGLTHSGDVIGTPHYIAPEQLRDMRSVDGRADVYALGVVLYRALEGRMPFSGSRAEVVAKSLTVPPEPLERPDIPPELAAVVLRALEKEPDERFPSMAAFGAALAPYALMTPIIVEALTELGQAAPISSLAASIHGPPSSPVASVHAPPPPASTNGAPHAVPATTTSRGRALVGAVAALVGLVVVALVVTSAWRARAARIPTGDTAPAASPGPLASASAAQVEPTRPASEISAPASASASASTSSSAPPATTSQAPASPNARPRRHVDCDPPYTLSADGKMRIPKRECLR